MSVFVAGNRVSTLEEPDLGTLPKPDLPEIELPSTDVDDLVRIMSVVETDWAGRTHWHVDVPAELRDWAREASKSERDTRDARDSKTSSEHSVQGKIAEGVVAAVCENEGVDWDWHDGYQTGDLEIGALTADVKSRIQNEGYHMDLLVGMRRAGNESDIRADTYIQVLLSKDFNSALVTGWTLNNEVRDAGRFFGAKTYPSKIVDHDDLRDLENLF
ncbi:hypothetical protein [Natronobeatus ordinarius]|uniref:hypothetical protein n=1 Tax=Natronobeatus ordinarius TaxID=2963433 RepID=UPI0020CEC4C1|nr:hypothetical protein [Natronobeatus ordinarius]